MSVEAETNTRSNEIVRPRRKWHRVRLAVQAVLFLLFIFLVVATRQSWVPAAHDIFFNLDPLAGIASMLASRSWIAPMALGVIIIILAVVAGRAWCSWICPLGTVLDWTPSRRPGRKKLDIHPNWRYIKYFFLFTILFAALAGSLTLIVLDPITVLFRTVAGVVLPGLGWLLETTENWLYGFGALQTALEGFDRVVRGWLITGQPFFLPNLAIAGLFVMVLVLNVVRPRFWCRYLCPLGALLGLLSRIAPFSHHVNTEKCISCNRCAVTCPTGAIDPKQQFAANAAECTTCLECMEICPTLAISFNLQRRTVAREMVPSRRRFLASIGGAIAGAVLLGIAPVAGWIGSRIIRPPGTSDEKLFSECIRCGECVKVCPTGAIQPDHRGVGWTGAWTPAITPRVGYCDYSCNSCGQVCPTQAIPLLTLEQKRQQVIGKAEIDTSRCIPWAEGRDCIVCEEMCPVPQKAIQLQEQRVVNIEGKEVTVLVPRLRRNRCIGCGICEYQCPVNGEAAIRVFP
jgi:polyferredoxin